MKRRSRALYILYRESPRNDTGWCTSDFTAGGHLRARLEGGAPRDDRGLDGGADDPLLQAVLGDEALVAVRRHEEAAGHPEARAHHVGERAALAADRLQRVVGRVQRHAGVRGGGGAALHARVDEAEAAAVGAGLLARGGRHADGGWDGDGNGGPAVMPITSYLGKHNFDRLRRALRSR